MADGKDPVPQNNSLIRVTNITSPQSNPTYAPTFYSRATGAVCWLRLSFDWKGQGYCAGALARWASGLGGLSEAQGFINIGTERWKTI